jgi:hypothetical protein
MEIFKNWIQPQTYSKIGFEDVKYAIKYPETHILINTLSLGSQQNLIKNTIPAEKEEFTINHIIEDYKMNDMKILIYGRNATDESIEKKAKQIISLGFVQVFLYYGGLFEWFLLQEIYGFNEFPTTYYSKTVDLLKYKPEKRFDLLRLEY